MRPTVTTRVSAPPPPPPTTTSPPSAPEEAFEPIAPPEQGAGSFGPDEAGEGSVGLEVLALPDEPVVEPDSRPAAEPASRGSSEPGVRRGDQAPEELKQDPAPADRQPDAPGPRPPAISEIPDWVPLVGGFNPLPAEAVARGGVELWRKTRVVASAIGAAPVGVLLFGLALHHARRRRPWLGSPEEDPAADPN